MVDEEKRIERMAHQRSARLGNMVELLFQHADDIDRLQTGTVEFHCSSGRVVLKVNGSIGERKVG